MSDSVDIDALGRIIQKVKKLANRFRDITGKPLGITGEIGEYYAAKILNLKLSEARQPGYDAIDRNRQKVQIKTRCVLPSSKTSQRLGSIRLKYPWDKVVLVLVDQHYEPFEIYQANRKDIESELKKPSSKVRNQRGQLSIICFKRLAGNPIWKKG